MIVEKDRGLTDVRFTAVVTKEELRKIDDKDDLTDIVMSRSNTK
jgi:predicted transcriptional regulator